MKAQSAGILVYRFVGRRLQEYPEVHRGQWLDVPQARRKIVKGQARFIDALLEKLPAAATDPGRRRT